MGPSVAEICIKFIGIVLTAYSIILRSRSDQMSVRRKALGVTVSVLLGAAIGSIYNLVPIGVISSVMIVFCFVISKLHGTSRQKAIVHTIVSFAISFFLCFAATLFLLFLLFLNKTVVMNRIGNSLEAWILVGRYATSFWGGIISRSIIFCVQFLLLALLLKNKKTKSVVNRLMQVKRIDIPVYLCAISLSMRALIMVEAFRRSDVQAVTMICVFLVILMSLTFFFWLGKEYRLIYHIRLQENELRLMERSLDCKEAYFKSLRSVNERLGALIHRDNKLIPSVMMSVRQAVCESGKPGDGSGFCEAAETLGEIFAERSAVLSLYEAGVRDLPATGVTEIDAVLMYLSVRADSLGIRFTVRITADSGVIPEKKVERREWIAVLNAMCEYSFSSSKGENRATEVMIGQEKGALYISVSDNGERFNRKQLKRTGKRRADSSSSGEEEPVVFIPLFRILRHSGAVLTVNEFPENKSFVKTLRVTFNAN